MFETRKERRRSIRALSLNTGELNYNGVKELQRKKILN